MDIVVFAPILAPVLVGLLALVKTAGLEARWVPLLSVILGVAFNYTAVVTGAIVVTGSAGSAAVFFSILYGAMSGLSACGLYSGWKATTT